MSILIITCLTALLQWLFLIVVAKEITSILGISVFLTKQTVERRKNKKLVSYNLNSAIHSPSQSYDDIYTDHLNSLRDPLLP